MSKKKICFISSTGGHFEQLLQLQDVKKTFQYFYVLPESDSFNKFKEPKYLLKPVTRKNKIAFLYTYALSFAQQIIIFLKERPDAVITTGAGFAVPMCIIAKVFQKKVIYIESFARIKTGNKSGKLIYKFADLFIVQWEELLEVYPKAKYGGWIY